MSSKSITSSESTQPHPNVLSQISDFIARYLSCSQHQLTVLALWVLHTYCADAAQVTPYLSIQSTHKQSGKTLCLHLLQLLCEFPALATGLPSPQLIKVLHGPNATFLIDECQATLGTRTRNKAPALRALLTSGFQRNPEFFACLFGRNAFRPKVFAGMGQLPEQLADRSIPIILEPIHARVAPPPSAVSSSDDPSTSKPTILRFSLRQAEPQAQSLREQLRNWAQENLPDLKEIPPYSEEDFPPNLSPRRQDMIEPLLQLADRVGGQWPARTREAVVTLFEEGTAFDLQPNLQVLSELHHCFFHYGFPDRLSTSVMVEWLQAVPNRPWETEGQINAARLARLLYPFEIRPRVLRTGNGKDNKDTSKTARGYLLEGFLDPWRRRLNFIIPGKTLTSPPVVGLGPSAANTKASNFAPAIKLIEALNRSQHAANQDAAHETQSKITNQNSKISSNDGHCYGVTQDREGNFNQTNPSVRDLSKTPPAPVRRGARRGPKARRGVSPVPCSAALPHDVTGSNGHTKIGMQSANADQKILQTQSNPAPKNPVNGLKQSANGSQAGGG